MSQTLEEAFGRIETLEGVSLEEIQQENVKLKVKLELDEGLLKESIADSDGTIAAMRDNITKKDEALKLAKLEIEELKGSLAKNQEIIKELEEKNLAQEAKIKKVLDEKKKALEHAEELREENMELQTIRDSIPKSQDQIDRALLQYEEREKEHAGLQKEVALQKEMDIKNARKEALGENKSASPMEDEKETNKKGKKKGKKRNR